MKYKLKFLADVNILKVIVETLVEQGFDTKWMLKINSRMSDKDILRYAIKDSRIILTNDKDFGELIFKDNMKSNGIILFRGDEEKNESLSLRISSLNKLIEFYTDEIFGNFIVISEKKKSE